VRDGKKRGRPFGTTKQNIEKKKQNPTDISPTSNPSSEEKK